MAAREASCVVTTMLTLIVTIGLAVATLLARAIVRKRSGRTQVALPAILAWARRDERITSCADFARRACAWGSRNHGTEP